MNLSEPSMRRKAMPLLVFALLLAALAATGLFETAEDGAYALGVRLSATRRASERFTVVLVDANTARATGDWPWPGPRLAELVARISAAEPLGIAWMLPLDRVAAPGVTGALDRLAALLPENPDALATLEELRQRLDPDAALAEALTTSGKVLLGVPAADYDGDPLTARLLMTRQLHHVSGGRRDVLIPGSFRPPEFPPLEWWRGGFAPPEPRQFQPQATAEVLVNSAQGVGLLPESDEFWRQPLVWRVNGAYLPSLPLLMAAVASARTPADILVQKGVGLSMGSDRIPTSGKLEALPYFYPDAGPGAITHHPAELVLAGEVGASQLRDRMVLVGLTNGQEVGTPIDVVPPAIAIAQTAASLYAGDVYRKPVWAGWLQLFAWMGVLAWLLLLAPRLKTRGAVLGSVILAAALLIAELALLVSQSLWLPLVAPALALLMGQVLLHGHRWLQDRRAAQARVVGDAYLALGEALRAQGQLDRAFEAFSHCMPGDTIERQLHDLGLDYERKRHYAKALRVYRQLKSFAPHYPEINTRINRLQALEEQSLRSRYSGPIDTVALGDEVVNRPRIGRYEIQRELGRGAMGIVYLGTDSRISREVAIKTLPLGDEFSGDALEDVKARFFREAEAAGRLSHPNIVTVYDVGEEDDLAYIAMDFLRGESLAEHVKEGTLLPIERVLKIGAAVADALHYAHELGVVHRDVKPANMVLTRDQYDVKVTDFGVAHITDASTTRTGTILGSPSFMSPEQVAGRRVDGRSDLWSLGVTLYQLLTGHLPFTGEPLATLMYRIANEPAEELRSWRPDIPECVAAVIAKALTKDPSARYQTGRGMAGAIRLCLTKLGTTKAKPSKA